MAVCSFYSRDIFVIYKGKTKQTFGLKAYFQPKNQTQLNNDLCQLLPMVFTQFDQFQTNNSQWMPFPKRSEELLKNWRLCSPQRLITENTSLFYGFFCISDVSSQQKRNLSISGKKLNEHALNTIFQDHESIIPNKRVFVWESWDCH